MLTLIDIVIVTKCCGKNKVTINQLQFSIMHTGIIDSGLNVNMKIVYSVCAQMCSFYETSIDFWPSSLTDTIILLSQQFQS